MKNDTPLKPLRAPRPAAVQCKPEGGNVNLQLIEWTEIIVFTAFGLSVAAFADVFRRKSIAGPRNLHPDGASATDLLIPALAGFSASLFAPATYYALIMGHDHHKPTSHQTVCMFAISAAAGLIMLQLIDVFQRRNQLRPRYMPEGIAIGVVGALAVIPLVLAATIIVQAVMRRFGTQPPEEHALLIVFQQPAIFDRLLVILSAVILAPLFEELTFRAHLQSAIRRVTGNQWLAVVVVSALFAFVHGIWWMMPPLFLLAIGLGYLYERTKNIWATITLHAIFNALSLTVEYISMKHR
jgi:membrane protease YdiL (CAAX protease family)